MKIYVAGKYTSGYVIENIRQAVDAGEVLMNAGHIPFIPHLTGFWDIIHRHSYREWVEYDKEWLRACDAVLRLPGESKGADEEVALAQELGIPVFFGLMNVPGMR